MYNVPTLNNDASPIQELLISSSSVHLDLDFNFTVDVNLNLNPGHNYIYFSAEDSAGNTSVRSSIIHYVLDNDPPPVPTIQIENQSGLSSTNLKITWQGVDVLSPTYYDLDFSTSSFDWQNLVLSTTTNQYDFFGTRGESYFFRVRAIDILGNTSAWSNESTAPSANIINYRGDVVINEVAWAGAMGYADDEWIEFYNNTDQDIVFASTSASARWQIKVGGRTINFSTIKNAVIPAHGYYLLERTRDESVREVAADVIYSLQYGFKNTGEKIELFNPAGEKIDEVDCGSGWFKGDNVKYRTMERISTTVSGNNPTNWQSNQGPRYVPRTYNGGPVYGTPKMSNFGFLSLKDRQEDNVVTLVKANNPYILSTYEIPVGMTLVIEPGVIIKSNYAAAKIDVRGTLQINGTVGEPVILTSGRDQSFANILDNTVVGSSWSTIVPQSGDMQGLQFYSGAVGNINNMEIRYGGYAFRPPGAQMYTPSVKQVVRADNAVVNLSGVKFLSSQGTCVYTKTCAVNINNSEFDGGDIGVDVADGALTITSSRFINFTNSLGPVVVYNIWPETKEVVYENNQLNSLYLLNTMLATDTTFVAGSIYSLSSLSVPTGVTLTIEPGVTLRMPRYASITVDGTVNANGTADQPIKFLPLNTSDPWGRLIFTSSTSNLNYVDFISGNLDASGGSWNGIVVGDNSDLTFNNCQFLESRPPGNSVRLRNSIVNINNSTIGYVTKPNFNNIIGIAVSGGQLNLNNTLFMNLDYGVYSLDIPPPALNFINTTMDNFISVAHPWEPNLWLSFATST
ncbi:MAG: RHS repeat-associated core domain protein [Candidatus Magasanikbacteria bacterium GW2011_GWA2_37_8]|uniref:RHS repeat-associated core domain protein n=1 Tax=Candidatus Magasanikbacteria bacterium GW2011_GWA2_37_8 TaxID=1619036 RepID=A0A0G0HEN6_9BACT|nr:MAG: RHS repeat-associated core domain protein [Candidatus Magasanikbacteria bacterium GW2011_GWA2_37_8]